MNFLKTLFGSGGNRSFDGRSAYYYVRPHRCDDILRIRIDTHNDLSQRDDDNGYWVRKLASSANYKCNQIEITLYYDSNRRLENQEIQGGTFVEKADYDAWLTEQAASAEEG